MFHRSQDMNFSSKVPFCTKNDKNMIKMGVQMVKMGVQCSYTHKYRPRRGEMVYSIFTNNFSVFTVVRFTRTISISWRFRLYERVFTNLGHRWERTNHTVRCRSVQMYSYEYKFVAVPEFVRPEYVARRSHNTAAGCPTVP